MGTVSNLSMLPAQIAAKVRIDEATGCWLWTGYIDPAGYGRGGRIPGSKTKTSLAHRFIWTLLKGPIPEKLVIDHLCRVRHCVNPSHLDAVTWEENAHRIQSIGRPNTNGRCRTGKHPWIPANIYLAPSGVGQCRLCRKETQRRFSAAGKDRKARPGPGQGSLL